MRAHGLANRRLSNKIRFAKKLPGEQMNWHYRAIHAKPGLGADFYFPMSCRLW